MIDVQHYRVRLRARIVGSTADELGDWAFGALDALLDDVVVVDADVAATLATGLVEFDLQIRADTVHDAMRLGSEAVGRAAATATGSRRPDIDHAEVDLVAAPA